MEAKDEQVPQREDASTEVQNTESNSFQECSAPATEKQGEASEVCDYSQKRIQIGRGSLPFVSH